jgi:hypothetical protein
VGQQANQAKYVYAFKSLTDAAKACSKSSNGTSPDCLGAAARSFIWIKQPSAHNSSYNSMDGVLEDLL